MNGRCMKCKENREMKDVAIDRTKRGGYMVKGLCTTCECKMVKIVSKDTAVQLSESLEIPIP